LIMKKIVLLLSLLLSFTLAFTQGLYLDPGKTISTDDRNGIPAFSYAFDNSLHSVTIELELGSASSDLFEAVALGTSFKKMELKSYDAKNKVEFTFVFSDVLVTSTQVSGGATQLVTLSFSKFSTK
jgi:type VI protein secretion system component Hcp